MTKIKQFPARFISADIDGKRQTSSVDYQTKGKGKPITTKPVKRKNQQQQQQQNQGEEQQHYYQQRPRYPTRARGSGIPPKHYDLSQIEHMSELELLQLMQHDPEFAAVAHSYREEAAARKTKEKQKSPTAKPSSAKESSRDRYYRAADGTAQDVSQYPNHVRELMDSGVPVTQWVVLLLLLGASIYQLRKTLIGPEKKKTGSSSNRNKARGSDNGGRGKNKKQQKNQNRGDSSKNAKVRKVSVAKPKAPAKEPAKKPTQSIEISEPTKKEAPIKKEAPVPSTNPEKPKKKKKAKNGASKKEEKQQPDLISTDGSAQHEEGENDNKHMSPVASPPIHTVPEDDGGVWETVSKSRKESENVPPAVDPPIVSTEKDDDGGGWETVTKSRKASSTPAAPAPQPKAPEEAAPPSSSAPMPEVAEEQTTKGDNPASEEENVETDAGFTSVSKKKKKNKKNKAKQQEAPTESPAPKNGVSSSTDDDAALALMLQQEEETLAKAGEAEPEEVWEEVTTKKRKGQKGLSAQ